MRPKLERNVRKCFICKDDIEVNEDSDNITVDLTNHFDDVEDGDNLNYLNPDVKLRDLLNPKGIGTKLINNNEHIIVLTEEKFQKQWKMQIPHK